MVTLIEQIQPALKFIPPAFNPTVFNASKLILPWYIKQNEAISKIETENIAKLAQLYQEFNTGKTRFLLAFRHPSTSDPLCLFYLIWHLLPKEIKQQKINLKNTPHAHCIYDRGIPIWAGSLTQWLFPKLGATSIQRGKLDREGLKSARNLMINGQFPLAASPEGGTNGHSQIISPLEPGLAQICFWAVEDLNKENRSEQVLIVPVGIQYQYVEESWENLALILSQLEQDLGIKDQEIQGLNINNLPDQLVKHQDLYFKLLRIGERLLTLMEKFYTEFYNQALPEIGAITDPNEKISFRMNALLELALLVSEKHFKVQSKGSLIDRCRRLEQAGWNRIYREDYDNLSPVETGLGNWLASEASLYMQHMRIVEKFSAVTGKYIRENPSFDRFAETVLLVARLIDLIKGITKNDQLNLGKKQVKMTIGEPLSVSQRWEDYQKSRRQAVENLTKDLQFSLECLINH